MGLGKLGDFLGLGDYSEGILMLVVLDLYDRLVFYFGGLGIFSD